jgi:hypothetical protein
MWPEQVWDGVGDNDRVLPGGRCPALWCHTPAWSCR